MITDANFKVYMLIVNGEKHSIHPNRASMDDLVLKMHNDETSALDNWNFEIFTVKSTKDLEDVMEDDVDDARFEAWERASLSGKIVEGL